MFQNFEYIINDEVAPDEVRLLLNQTDWAQGRDEASLAKMIEFSLVHVSLRNDNHLVGFARAIGDGVYRALIEDVVVHEAWRKKGAGRGLLDTLLGELAGVEQIQLFCRPELEGFYRQLGFERNETMAIPRSKTITQAN